MNLRKSRRIVDPNQKNLCLNLLPREYEMVKETDSYYCTVPLNPADQKGGKKNL